MECGEMKLPRSGKRVGWKSSERAEAAGPLLGGELAQLAGAAGVGAAIATSSEGATLGGFRDVTNVVFGAVFEFALGTGHCKSPL